jgi:DNA polymerase III alpha subunit
MRNEFKMEGKTFLKGHTSAETAYIIDSYPYGRLRCQMKVWIENSRNGLQQREVRQTQNPKTLRWNAPKKSTYSNLVFMYKNHENGHINTYHVSYNYSSVEEVKKQYSIIINNGLELNNGQKAHMKSAIIQLMISSLNWSFRDYTPDTLQTVKEILKRNIERIKTNDFENLFNDFEQYPAPEVKPEDQESYFTSTVYKGISNIINNRPEPSEEKPRSENELKLIEIMTTA